MDSFEIPSFVRGYHAYKDVWTPTLGQSLVLRHEPDNIVDESAVAVMNDDLVVGHVPVNISPLLFHFLPRDGNTGFSEITGNRVNRGAGYGLKILCIYWLYGPKRFIDRLKKLVLDIKQKGFV